tara:strand:- start:116 stop:589 length:474 start_codon:yes stop_codon:yes gene_type:complete
MKSKLVSLKNFIKIRRSRLSKKSLVMTNGCFDILHAGHIEYLYKSRKLGDKLLIAVNSDKSIKLLKGKKRPIINFNDRIKILSSLNFVDFIIKFDAKTPDRLYKMIKPNILTKGDEYKKINLIAGSNDVLKAGGKVKLINMKKNYSTTNIINKIKCI